MGGFFYYLSAGLAFVYLQSKMRKIAHFHCKYKRRARPNFVSKNYQFFKNIILSAKN